MLAAVHLDNTAAQRERLFKKIGEAFRKAVIVKHLRKVALGLAVAAHKLGTLGEAQPRKLGTQRLCRAQCRKLSRAAVHSAFSCIAPVSAAVVDIQPPCDVAAVFRRDGGGCCAFCGISSAEKQTFKVQFHSSLFEPVRIARNVKCGNVNTFRIIRGPVAPLRCVFD